MSLPRLALLLAFVALPASAAPAPLPRKQEAPNAGAWSEPVAGLRVRLTSSKKKYRPGEPVLLTLEVQNVGKAAVMVEEPRLLPVIARPGRSHYRGTRYYWAITCGPPRQEARRLEQEEKELLRRVQPGETLRVEVAAGGSAKGEEEEQLRKLEELETEEESRRQKMAFPAAERPGLYELRATFSGRKGGRRLGGWGGAPLESPPIRIERTK